MKSILVSFFLISTLCAFGQSKDSEDVKNTVVQFFSAFHVQDSVGLRNLVSSDIVLQTIGKSKNGETILRKENYDDFINSIVSIPDSINFQERLLDFSIKIDGSMANAWTPYEFWINDTFSHCGVNSFQMVKLEGEWKIIYLIDTRRREGCEGQSN